MNYTLFDIIIYNTINYLDFKSLVALISTNKQVLNIIEKNINNLNKGLANNIFNYVVNMVILPLLKYY